MLLICFIEESSIWGPYHRLSQWIAMHNKPNETSVLRELFFFGRSISSNSRRMRERGTNRLLFHHLFANTTTASTSAIIDKRARDVKQEEREWLHGVDMGTLTLDQRARYVTQEGRERERERERESVCPVFGSQLGDVKKEEREWLHGVDMGTLTLDQAFNPGIS